MNGIKQKMQQKNVSVQVTLYQKRRKTLNLVGSFDDDHINFMTRFKYAFPLYIKYFDYT